MASQFWELAVQEMRQQGLFDKTNRVNYESLNREIEGGANPLGGQKITVCFRRMSFPKSQKNIGDPLKV